jgi:hypothetical protein
MAKKKTTYSRSASSLKRELEEEAKKLKERIEKGARKATASAKKAKKKASKSKSAKAAKSGAKQLAKAAKALPGPAKIAGVAAVGIGTYVAGKRSGRQEGSRVDIGNAAYRGGRRR